MKLPNTYGLVAEEDDGTLTPLVYRLELDYCFTQKGREVAITLTPRNNIEVSFPPYLYGKYVKDVWLAEIVQSDSRIEYNLLMTVFDEAYKTYGRIATHEGDAFRVRFFTLAMTQN